MKKMKKFLWLSSVVAPTALIPVISSTAGETSSAEQPATTTTNENTAPNTTSGENTNTAPATNSNENSSNTAATPAESNTNADQPKSESTKRAPQPKWALYSVIALAIITVALLIAIIVMLIKRFKKSKNK